MNSWINLDALWKIVVIGLLAGAGLPALFAVGLRALAPATRTADPKAGAVPAPDVPAPELRGKVIAGICFVAVLAAMAWGVYSIVHSG
ncbi:MAG: hypothetical protein HOV87_24425 [Catenulispora sp.]|nr:hypothetical protein [Catenulispora sp.]